MRAELRKALLIGTAITMLNVWENTAVVKEITERIQQAIQNNLPVSYSSYGCSLNLSKKVNAKATDLYELHPICQTE